MDVIIAIIKGIHIIVSVLLIITVLLQPGKGDIGSVFGGTTESIFGASGAVPFLTKVTRILAVLFMVSSLSLGYFSAKSVRSSVVKEQAPVSIEEKSQQEAGEQKPSDVSSTTTDPKGKGEEPDLTKEPGKVKGQEPKSQDKKDSD